MLFKLCQPSAQTSVFRASVCTVWSLLIFNIVVFFRFVFIFISFVWIKRPSCMLHVHIIKCVVKINLTALNREYRICGGKWKEKCSTLGASSHRWVLIPLHALMSKFLCTKKSPSIFILVCRWMCFRIANKSLAKLFHRKKQIQDKNGENLTK